MQRIPVKVVFARSSSPNISRMQNISAQKLAFLALALLFYCHSLPAQQQDEVIIVKRKALKSIETAGNDRPILGIYTDETAGTNGIKIKSVIAGKGAELAGLQAGDVIVKVNEINVGKVDNEINLLNGEAVSLTSGLHAVLSGHKPGDKVHVQYLRDGENKITAVELSGGSHFYNVDWNTENERRDPCRVFIGVGTSSVQGGLKVDYTVDNTPATQYGVQPGDIIQAIDDIYINSQPELVYERDKHQPGDPFTLTILRDGREMKIDARFKTCTEEEKQRTRLAIIAPKAHLFSHKVERDPCAVFIGVYTTDRAMNEQGVRISGVIDNTPAQESGLQPGDIILALDGQPLATHSELRRERDKHRPGDLFHLTIQREGVNLEIDAYFKSCPTETENKVTVDETVKMDTEGAPATQREDATLQLESLELYPNPTFGPLNVQFQGDAVPTTVRIADVTGKVVYTRDIPQFSGQFSEQINLFGKTPGNYVLSVQQGDKILTRPVVLLPRA